MIKGTGSLISEDDEEGVAIPFLTTDEILQQISKFGFLVEYDVKSNLPENVISYLSSLYNLGYDKLNRINVKTRNKDGVIYVRPTIVAMKSCEATIDFMEFDKYTTEIDFAKMLDLNVMINATNEPDTVWDWVHYMCNIYDILEENIDPTDDFETDTDIETGSDADPLLAPEGFTPYTGDEDDGD